MHAEEFRRMGAEIKIEGRSVIMDGPTALQGAEVAATDLRAAAALSIAGLVADGYTRVTELKHLDRGYVNFHQKLAALGADIERVNEADETPATEETMINAVGYQPTLATEMGQLQERITSTNVGDRKSTRLNSSHVALSRMPSSA